MTIIYIGFDDQIPVGRQHSPAQHLLHNVDAAGTQLAVIGLRHWV